MRLLRWFACAAALATACSSGEPDQAVAESQSQSPELTELVGKLEGMNDASRFSYVVRAVEESTEVVVLSPGEHEVSLGAVDSQEASLSASGEFRITGLDRTKQWSLEVSASPRTAGSLGESRIANESVLDGIPAESSGGMQVLTLPPHQIVSLDVVGPESARGEVVSVRISDADGGGSFEFVPLGRSELVLVDGRYLVLAHVEGAASPLVEFEVDASEPDLSLRLELQATQPFACTLVNPDGTTPEDDFVWIGPAETQGIPGLTRHALFSERGRIEVEGLLPGTYTAAFRYWGIAEASELQQVEIKPDGVITKGAAPPAPAMATDDARHAVWSLALATESAGMRMFTEANEHFVLYYDRTLVLACPEPGAAEVLAQRVRECKPDLPRLREDTLEAFLGAGRNQGTIDAAMIRTAYPCRPARPPEMDGFLGLTDAAEAGAAGLLCVSDVGFSAEGSQALVLVHSWRVDAPNPFQWLMLFERVGTQWDCVGTSQQPGLPLCLPLK